MNNRPIQPRFGMLRSASLAMCAGLLMALQVQPAMAAPAVADIARPSAVFTNVSPATGVPFGATAMDLRARGYVEEEFIASGTANRYRTKDVMATAQVVDSGHPYTTRILVRRPADPKKFNGRVMVEWFNVSGSQDAEFVFAAVRDHALAQGYAWVGVSAQLVGVNALKTANPKRYGQLSIAASNDDPLGGKLDEADDVLSWDIFTQVANGLRVALGSAAPLGGVKPTLVLAVGESQSAARLSKYYNTVYPLSKSTFDGFLLYDRLLNDMRPDVGTKLLSFGSEILRATVGPASADNPNLRVWEVAGAAHLSFEEMDQYWDEQFVRNGVLKALDGHPISLSQTFIGCDNYPLWSRVPNGQVLTAGLEALAAWISSGKAPPTAERLHGDANGKLVRDALNRVSGGIRLAAYDVPISMNSGANSGPGFACALAGSHQDYSVGQLRQLYGTPVHYVARVSAVTRKAVSDGFILPADAERTIREAKEVKF